MAAKSYLERTYNAKNPLVRWAHRSRFKKSLQAITIVDNAKILDFGCGDGMFLNLLKKSTKKQISLVGFEPYMAAVSENEVDIFKDWNDIVGLVANKGRFDYVTCFEVLEHFGPERQAEALNKMKSMLSNNGHIIISVPVEIGFPSLIKNIVRKINQPKERYYYKVENIFKSLLGIPLPQFRNNQDYLAHMGFYFKDLEKVFASCNLLIQEKYFSPIDGLGHNLSSQVFYKLKMQA